MSLYSGSAPMACSVHELQVLHGIVEYIDLLAKRTISGMTMYGVYFVLSGLAMHSLVKRPNKSRQTWILLSAFIVTFLVVTVLCAVDLINLLTELRIPLVNDPTETFTDRMTAYNRQGWARPGVVLTIIVGGTADTGILFIIIDSLAAWRAIALWTSSSRHYISIVPCFLILSSFVISLPFMILNIKVYLDPDAPKSFSNSDGMAITGITASVLSIAANLFTTCMMGYTAYIHISLESLSGIRSLRLTGTRVLILLTESGLLYAVIQIIRLALTVSIVPSTSQNGSLVTAFQIFERTTSIIAAMYPPALILIINYNYSMEETTTPICFDTAIFRSTSNPPTHDPPSLAYPPRGTSDVVFHRRRLCPCCEMDELDLEDGDSGPDALEVSEMRSEEVGRKSVSFCREV
jgi:hypothetical protein